MGPADLQAKLSELRKRQWTLGGVTTVLWSLSVTLLTLIATGWLDLLVDLSAGARAACWLAVAGAVGVAVIVVVRGTAFGGRTEMLVRRLDDACDGRGQIAAGVSLMQRPPAGANATTAGLTAMAVQLAGDLAARSNATVVLPAKALRFPSEVFGVLINLLLLGLVCLPRLVTTEAARLFDPYGDHPPYSPLEFAVTPGDTRVVFGGDAEVQATITGGQAEDVKLVLRRDNGSESMLPMFETGAGQYRATVLNVDAEQQYYVTSGRARSVRYSIGVITIPKLADVAFAVALPAYTHRPPYRGPLPKDGLSGLPGTKVDVTIRSNRELSKGTIHFTADDGSAATDIPMTPAGEAKTVSGSFVITTPGKIDLGVVDTDCQASTEPFSAPVKVLKDEKPFVRVKSPKPNSFATPDAVLDVSAIAEDDFGVSKVELFRSLNDGRFRPTPMPVPDAQPTQVPANLPLNLADHGLKPGDTVKLFVRVEDNDPAGAKGTESPVVQLTVISQDDFAQMVLAKQGLEAVEAKYDQARRELEAAAAEAKRLQDELAKRDPAAVVPEALRKQMDALSDRMQKAAAAIEKQADHPLPLDLDKALTPQLKETADTLKEAAEDAKKAGDSASVSGAAKKLKDLQDRVGQRQQEAKENVTDPLDHLDAIYPLLEDQAKFLQLAEQQRDLAERLKSLQSKSGESSPEVKARMRELQDEQQQTREQTNQLLQQIEEHAARLPEDKRLDDLRDSAKKFCETAHKVDPGTPMREGEEALQQFAGSPAAASADEAAKRLESLIGQCNSMGEEGEMCLKFQPKLSQGMGNTLKQLLESQNLGKGKMGSGQGGYSATRQTLQSVGLYGTTPLEGRESRTAGGGKADRGVASNANGKPSANTNPDGTTKGDNAKAEAGADAPVPPAYKGRVSDYFRRVADELETPTETGK